MWKARAALDALMGPARDDKETSKSKEKFKDSSICKMFLLGFCPLDPGYLGGKRKFEVCSKIHSEVMRDQFKAHAEYETLKVKYEQDALPTFKYVIMECDARIASEKQRIAEDWGHRRPPLPPDAVQEVHFMRRAHRVRLEEAEALDDDKYQDKIRLMKEAEELAKEANAFEERELQKAKDAAIPEEVCEVCGTAYHGSAGNAAHLAFKIHAAYQEARNKFAELETSVAKAREDGRAAAAAKPQGDGEKRGDEAGEKDGGGRRKEPRDVGNGDGRRDRSRERGKRESRSRGRGGGGKDQGRDRSRDRGGGGGRDYKRGRDSRSRSRGRRDRGRGREGGGRRDRY